MAFFCFKKVVDKPKQMLSREIITITLLFNEYKVLADRFEIFRIKRRDDISGSQSFVAGFALQKKESVTSN